MIISFLQSPVRFANIFQLREAHNVAGKLRDKLASKSWIKHNNIEWRSLNSLSPCSWRETCLFDVFFWCFSPPLWLASLLIFAQNKFTSLISGQIYILMISVEFLRLGGMRSMSLSVDGGKDWLPGAGDGVDLQSAPICLNVRHAGWLLDVFISTPRQKQRRHSVLF